ncbi:unnamed protein product [Natator depressus]
MLTGKQGESEGEIGCNFWDSRLCRGRVWTVAQCPQKDHDFLEFVQYSNLLDNFFLLWMHLGQLTANYFSLDLVTGCPSNPKAWRPSEKQTSFHALERLLLHRIQEICSVKAEGILVLYSLLHDYQL